MRINEQYTMMILMHLYTNMGWATDGFHLERNAVFTIGQTFRRSWDGEWQHWEIITMDSTFPRWRINCEHRHLITGSEFDCMIYNAIARYIPLPSPVLFLQ
jgi:hypothetical protein